MKYKIVCEIMILGVLFSCHTEKTEISIPLPQDENIKFSSLVGEIEIHPIFLNNDKEFLPESTKIYFKDGFLFVYDRDFTKGIRVFSDKDWKEITLPVGQGEGPNEYIEINDFSIVKNNLLLLDGVGKKVVTIDFRNGSLDFSKIIRLPGMYSRIAGDADYMYLYASGDDDQIIHAFDYDGDLLNRFHEKKIWHLLKPFNSFHTINHNGLQKVILHHTFEPYVYLMDVNSESVFGTHHFPSHNFFPKDHEFMDFAAVEEKAKDTFTRFLIYEVGNSSSFLLFFKNDVPYVHFKSESLNQSYPLFNVENDVTFSETLPKISGVDGDWFLATFERDEVVNPENGSKIKEILDLFPDAENFLLRLKIK